MLRSRLGDREAEKLIVSEKAATSDKDKQIISSFKVGDTIEGEISGVVDFGAFIKFSSKNDNGEDGNTLEGLVHISHLAKDRVNKVEDIIKLGDEILVKCIGTDKKGRLNFSRKEAL